MENCICQKRANSGLGVGKGKKYLFMHFLLYFIVKIRIGIIPIYL